MKRNSSRLAGAERVKAAYYSPKAFRCAPAQHELGAAGSLRTGRWVIGVVLVAAGFAAGHFWPREAVVSSGHDVVSPNLSEGLPVNVPPTGILAAATYAPSTELAPIKVIGAGAGTHCVFELARWDGNEMALRVFVRSGETVQSQLPLGRYRGTITCGTKRYGAGKFGSDNTRVMVVSPFVFERNAAGALQGVTVDLTRRPQGNLPTVRLD